MEHLLKEADEETRLAIQEMMSKMNPPDELIVEGLNTTDVQLAKVIYERLRDYITGTVLLSFLENRRQVKALQRELADLRRQYDRNSKLEAEHREALRKQLGRLERFLENMQMPVEKGSDKETQRRKYWNKQNIAADLIIKIARKLGITTS